MRQQLTNLILEILSEIIARKIQDYFTIEDTIVESRRRRLKKFQRARNRPNLRYYL